MTISLQLQEVYRWLICGTHNEIIMFSDVLELLIQKSTMLYNNPRYKRFETNSVWSKYSLQNDGVLVFVIREVLWCIYRHNAHIYDFSLFS